MGKTEESLEQGEASVREWLVRLRSGDATTEDRQAFERWCAEHPEEASFVPVMGEIWGKLGIAAAEVVAMKAQAESADASGVSRARSSRPGRRAFVGFALAAGASWLALRPPLQLWPALGDFAADWRTGTGEQRRIVLSERVAIEMNTQTRMDRLNVQDTMHGVELVAGEAEV